LVTRFYQLLKLDGTELFILFCYAFVAGLLALGVPLASQALVNNIAQGLFWQPLLVLTLAVFAGLFLSGTLKTLQFSLAEAVQQRLFARLGLRLTELLPRFEYGEFVNHHGPQELNKFFEIVNVQKSWNKLLVAVPASLVEAILSLAFLGLYGPNVLTLCLLALAGATLVLTLLGYKGVRTSLQASHAKYELAGWLEQIGRGHAEMKLSSLGPYLLAQSDHHVSEYLKHRQAHYRILMRQLFSFYGFQAAVSAGVLGLGGWLVIQREISLGQLVAMELVVLNLLKAGEKLVNSIPNFYSLLTGLEKLHHLLGLPLDPSGGEQLPASTRGLELSFRDVSAGHNPDELLLANVNLHIEPNERVTVIGAESCGRSTLGLLALGLLPPRKGLVELDGVAVQTLARSADVGWLSERQELLNTTVEENIRLGRDLSRHDLRWAVETSGLHEHLPRLPNGLNTEVLCGGHNLSSSQRQRILLARTLVARPRLLVIDALPGWDFDHRVNTVRHLFDRQQRWTILNLVSDTECLASSDRIVWLHQGKLLELGSPLECLKHEGFCRSFPHLSGRLRTRLEVR
jgi:ABC-type bacteriocin/lantibiotic exporter with double-glycine peptidase domain